MNKIYGIDLGTTNSLIGHGSELNSGLVPSIVSFSDKRAGSSYKDNASEDVVRSFKKNMSMGPEGKVAINASAVVLEELKRAVKDDTVKDVIITVPAYFTDNNRNATKEAAIKAGLVVHKLINEPTAAAMYYNHGKRTLTLVYDLGGGTFDISLVDNRLGDYFVVTTDGNKIGGDNLDSALEKVIMRDSKIVAHRLKDGDSLKLKLLAERAKIQIQKTRRDVTIKLDDFAYAGAKGDYVLTVDTYKVVMKQVFASTIKKTIRIVNNQSYLPIGEEYNLLLVGGSTRDPFLREWIAEEVGKEPEPISYDPDKIVAQGAAYCAELEENGELDLMLTDIVSSPIGIELIDGTMKFIVQKDSRLPIRESCPVVNSGKVSQLKLNIRQGQSKLAMDNELLGTMIFNYGREVEPNTGTVTVTLSVDNSGLVSLKAKYGRHKEQELVLDRQAYTERVDA